MKDTTKFKSWMALLVTIAVILILFILISNPMEPTSKEPVLLVLGALLMRLADVFSYYFGSSEGSDKKTDIIAQSQPVPPGTF